MINIRDIRIGNLVNFNSREYEIENISNQIIHLVDCDVRPKDIHPTNLYPIPLTEDWLVKLGFSRKDYRDNYIGIEVKGSGIITDFVVATEEFGIIYELREYFIVTLEYVHQLQNLFHAITGKELTLREDKGE